MRVRERKGWEASFHKSELVFFELWPLLPPFPRKTAEGEEEKGGERKNDARCPGKKKCRRFIYMADGGLLCAEAFLKKRK